MDLTVPAIEAFITQNASIERIIMKILTYSDVHLEFGRNWHPPRNIDGDVMLLAGDITSFKTYKPLKFFLRFWDKPVIYIAGNHEYYGTNMEPAERMAVEWISRKLPNVHYLKNSAVEINGVHFFGGTMWTDFDGNLHCMYFAQGSMNDYRQIRTDKTQRLKAEDTLKFHEEFVINLKNWFAQDLKGPRVVISHHAPIEEPAVVTRYYDGRISPAYTSYDAVKIIQEYQPDLWVYGHTHTSPETRKSGKPGSYQTLAVTPDGKTLAMFLISTPTANRWR